MKSSFVVAWQLFKLHWKPLLAAELLLLGLWITLEVSVICVSRLAHSWNLDVAGAVVNTLLHAGFLVLFSGLLASIHRLALSIVTGAPSPKTSFTSALLIGPSYLLANALYLVAVLAGSVALLLPGIYLATRLAFFRHILASSRRSPLDVLKSSAQLTRGHSLSLGAPTLVALALNITGAAAAGIGFFISWPVTVLACAERFRSLRAKTQPEPCQYAAEARLR